MLIELEVSTKSLVFPSCFDQLQSYRTDSIQKYQNAPINMRKNTTLQGEVTQGTVRQRGESEKKALLVMPKDSEPQAMKRTPQIRTTVESFFEHCLQQRSAKKTSEKWKSRKSGFLY